MPLSGLDEDIVEESALASWLGEGALEMFGRRPSGERAPPT